MPKKKSVGYFKDRKTPKIEVGKEGNGGVDKIVTPDEKPKVAKIPYEEEWTKSDLETLKSLRKSLNDPTVAPSAKQSYRDNIESLMNKYNKAYGIKKSYVGKKK